MEELKFLEPKQDYKVLCHCMTYNQADYIIDTMNGFCMQKTDFPFVCYIIDDASTDGEQDVIKTYLNDYFNIEAAEIIDIETASVIIAKHKTNENCTFAVYLLKQNLWKDTPLKNKHVEPWRKHCAYEALCEGDDYWIAPNKLQKQVDILDKDANIAMVFHRAKILMEIAGTPYLKCTHIENREYSATELFKDWIVPTASVVFRESILNYPIKNEEMILNGDIFLVEKCAHSGKVLGMSDFMSVYRMQQGGVTYDPNIQGSRIMKYPQHYECIAINFPKIEKRILDLFLRYSYWTRMSYQPKMIDKYNDFCEGAKYANFTESVKFLIKRIVHKINRLTRNI